MAKYTDAIRDNIIAAFNAGDQPTEAQFTNWITRIQQGIEEHDHAGGGDGDGVANLIGPTGVGCAPATMFEVQVPDAAGAATIATTLSMANFVGVLNNEVQLLLGPSNAINQSAGISATYRIAGSTGFSIYVGNAGASLEAVTLAGDGSFGLGVTPSHFMHIEKSVVDDMPLYVKNVNAAAIAGLGLIAHNGRYSTVYFGDTDDEDIGYIQYSHGADSMTFVTATNIAMTIDNAANVKIASLAGVGNRAVIAAADGTLSAP